MPKEIGDLRLYTVKEVAEKLGFLEKTIRKMLRDGELQGKKLGRRWFISEKFLKEYFEVEQKEKT